MSEDNIVIAATADPDTLRSLAEAIKGKAAELANYVNALAWFDERPHIPHLGEQCRQAVVERCDTLDEALAVLKRHVFRT